MHQQLAAITKGEALTAFAQINFALEHHIEPTLALAPREVLRGQLGFQRQHPVVRRNVGVDARRETRAIEEEFPRNLGRGRCAFGQAHRERELAAIALEKIELDGGHHHARGVRNTGAKGTAQKEQCEGEGDPSTSLGMNGGEPASLGMNGPAQSVSLRAAA